MSTILPTKELLQMIEERIPFGRLLTTAALLLAVLAIIVASFTYLYHSIVLPVVTLVSAGLTTGKINPSVFSSAITTFVATFVTYLVVEWLFKGSSSRLMREVLDSQTSVLKIDSDILAITENTNRQMAEVVKFVDEIEQRVHALEKGV